MKEIQLEDVKELCEKGSKIAASLMKMKNIVVVLIFMVLMASTMKSAGILMLLLRR